MTLVHFGAAATSQLTSRPVDRWTANVQLLHFATQLHPYHPARHFTYWTRQHNRNHEARQVCRSPKNPRASQMLKDCFKAALASAWLTWKYRFLMKCTNETVTVELKSGRLLCCYATPTARDMGLTSLHRHDHQWLNRISLAANEHKPPHSKNDRQGRLPSQSRPHLHSRQ
jgi:hypothetical protein